MERLTRNQRQILAHLLTIAPDGEQAAIHIARDGNIKTSSTYSGLKNLTDAGLVERQWTADPGTGVEARMYRLAPNGVALAQQLKNNAISSASDWRNLLQTVGGQA